MRFAVVIPTLNAGTEWSACVSAISSQSVGAEKVLVIDSGSSDQTVQTAQDAGFEVVPIRKKDFGHGRTRQLAVEMLGDYEFLIFMTQDAVPVNAESFKNLLRNFANDTVSAVNGRQLPRVGAGPIERHARLFNYPSKSHFRDMNDIRKYGLKTAFLSNSFSAYRRAALIEVGGFPENVIFGEDMYVAARLLQAGYKIVYAADACVFHSHDYSMVQDMSRYFDMGVFHAREPWIRRELGTAEGEGLKFVKSELKYLARNAIWRIPEGALRTLLRYAGFRLGLAEGRIPLNIKRKISLNPGYFNIR